MQPEQRALLDKTKTDLKKALGHLSYSLAKASGILARPSLSEDDLEALEGFGSRFARASDIAIQRYFRLRALQADPAFRGTVLDLLNESEKQGWVSSVEDWKRIRELRNVTAHEYSETEVKELYGEMIRLAPLLLRLEIQ